MTPRIVKQKIVPPPGLGFTVICPPWDSMMVRDIDSPIPMPCRFVVTKGLKSCRRYIRRDPAARVGNFDGNHLVFGWIGGNIQLAAFGGLHGLNRVAQQIEQDLLNLNLVDKNKVDGRVMLQVHSNRLILRGNKSERGGFFHQLLDALDPLFGFSTCDEVAEAMYDLPGPNSLLGSFVHRLHDALVCARQKYSVATVSTLEGSSQRPKAAD